MRGVDHSTFWNWVLGVVGFIVGSWSHVQDGLGHESEADGRSNRSLHVAASSSALAFSFARFTISSTNFRKIMLSSFSTASSGLVEGVGVAVAGPPTSTLEDVA